MLIMSRPKSFYRMKSSELDQVYERVPGSGKDGAEAEYEPLIECVQGKTLVREIRGGFYVHWAAEVFDREVRLRGLDGQGYFVFTFSLAGMWQDVMGTRRRIVDRPANSMALLRCDDLVEHRTLQTPAAVHLTIAIEQAQLRQWLGGQELEAHPRLRQFLNGQGDGCLVLPLTFRARQTVQQIQNCPFRGLTRTLAMEARCIDLLVEMIDQLEKPLETIPPGKSRFLAKNELDRIHDAAACLAASLDQPPGLAELARRFNLSESKLKAGFHQVFGTTAFGYLRQLRMEKARCFLEDQGSTILEAAHLVGVSNPSHFATLFKQHFGLNPKQFQMNAKRQK